MTFEEFFKEWLGESRTIGARTSGSTGVPKEIQLPKEFVERSARRTNTFFGIGSSSRLHSCVSPDFIGGKMMGVRSIISGARFSWETPSNTPLTSLDPDEEITLVAVVPSQVHYILDNLSVLPPVRNLLIGGSAIPPGLRRRISESGVTAFESYGMTETASHIALRRVTAEEGWFETLPGITVSGDSRGCLKIEFETGEEIASNDIAETEGDRQFRILGRIDNVIVTGGKKVHPESVESRLKTLLSGEILLTSEPDEKWGERIVLLAESREPDNAADLTGAMRKILEKWEMPKEIRWGVKLPRTPNGKIRRIKPEPTQNSPK